LQILTNDQAQLWCEGQGLQVTTNRFIAYQGSKQFSLTMELNEKPSRIIALANYLAPNWEDDFQGALLWFRDWGIWNDHHEDTGLKIVEEMRSKFNDSPSLLDAPAQVFEPQERSLMNSFFVLPLLFSWDAFLIPKAQNYFVFVSHDEIACIVAKDSATEGAVFQRVGRWNQKRIRIGISDDFISLTQTHRPYLGLSYYLAPARSRCILDAYHE
jgi:hypothetical protein